MNIMTELVNYCRKHNLEHIVGIQFQNKEIFSKITQKPTIFILINLQAFGSFLILIISLKRQKLQNKLGLGSGRFMPLLSVNVTE